MSRVPSPARRRQRGVAAVEFAILVPVLVVLLSAPLFIGRVLWHYTVMQKAAHDAARYLATVPEAEMRSTLLAPKAAAMATPIIEAELADLNTGTVAPAITVLCNGKSCTGIVPWTKVTVIIDAEVRDPFFRTRYGTDGGMVLTAQVDMNYIGTK